MTQRNRGTKILEENFVKPILETKTKTGKKTNQKRQAIALQKAFLSQVWNLTPNLSTQEAEAGRPLSLRLQRKF